MHASWCDGFFVSNIQAGGRFNQTLLKNRFLEKVLFSISINQIILSNLQPNIEIR